MYLRSAEGCVDCKLQSSKFPLTASVPGYVERTAPAVPESSGSTLGDVARSFRG